MIITLAVVTVAPEVWISNLTDGDVAAFGSPQTTGLGSHLIRLRGAELDTAGRLQFERKDALLIRRGRTAEAVLFRDLTGGRRVLTQVDAIVSPRDSVFWVTVGRGRQENFEIGMREGVWGVPEEYAARLRDVSTGDKVIFYGREVGFALCDVGSEPFHDTRRVWPDGDYPYRVRVTPPLKRNVADEFSAVCQHLIDRSGRSYRSPQAAGRAIGGAGGVFRRLNAQECAGLLRGLGWQETVARV